MNKQRNNKAESDIRPKFDDIDPHFHFIGPKSEDIDPNSIFIDPISKYIDPIPFQSHYKGLPFQPEGQTN